MENIEVLFVDNDNGFELSAEVRHLPAVGETYVITSQKNEYETEDATAKIYTVVEQEWELQYVEDDPDTVYNSENRIIYRANKEICVIHLQLVQTIHRNEKEKN